QPTPPPRDDSTLRLVIDASEDSWIDLDVDGQPAIDEVVHKGEQRAFEAKERFYFRVIGNAGGVSLTLNETPIPSVGEKGKARRKLVFDRAKLEELRSSTP
ncbi:MAG TPA: DUF4115 domain-containing protein, partial [Thermoanaerobaculia bacterium]|nr:DUF4115 domain-containing protein [Thermoanaerobaculia bacterium]